MKKFALISIILFSVMASFGQVLPPFINNTSISNGQTIYHIKGAVKGDVSLMLPIVDTLNNPATPYVGSLTVRPQDTLINPDNPAIYMSNGRFWNRIVSGGTGQGIDSITHNIDSTLYIAWNGGNQVFSFSTLLRKVKPGTGVTFTYSGDTLVISSTGGGGGGGTYTASNGLTMVSNDNRLGGTLTQNTLITAGAFNLTVQSANGTDVLQGITTGSGTGVFGQTVTGSGVRGVSTNSGGGGSGVSASAVGGAAFFGNNTSTGNPVLSLSKAPTSTNTVSPMITMTRGTSGTAANGLGQTVVMYTQTTDGSSPESNAFISKWTNATTASRVSQFIITGADNAVTADLLTLSGNGGLKLNKYGVGTFVGTPAYSIGADASGNLVEYTYVPPAAVGWLTTGNSGTDGTVNFLGTTDDQPLVFKVNSIYAGTIETGFTGNVSLGKLAGFLATPQINGTSIGSSAGQYNVSGTGSTNVGAYAGWKNTGESNTNVGAGSDGNAGAVNNNTAIGVNSMGTNFNGSFSVAVGALAADNGEVNQGVFLGANTHPVGDTNEVVIGYDASGRGNNSVVLGNELNDSTFLGGYDSANVIGTPDYAIGITTRGQLVKFAVPTGASTLQQLFNNEPGGSVMDRQDTIIGDSHTLKMLFNGITSNAGVSIQSNSTAASGQSQRLLDVSLSGTNATGQDTYAVLVQNTHVDENGGFNYGVFSSVGGSNSTNIAIAGEAESSGDIGVKGKSSNGYAVFGQSSVGFGVVGQATSGTAIQGIATNGTGVSAQAQSSPGIGLDAGAFDGISGRFYAGSTATNSIIPAIEIDRTPYAPGTLGIGVSIDYKIVTDDVSLIPQLSNQLISRWTDITDASRTSQFDITGVNNAVTETFANFQTGSIVIVGNGADTLATKSYARSVGGGGGGGSETLDQVINNGNLFTTDRSIDINNFNFSIKNGALAVPGLQVNSDGAGNISSVNLSAYDATGDGNGANFFGSSSASSGTAFLNAYFNDGAKMAIINASATSDSSKFGYLADVHVFTGDLYDIIPSGYPLLKISHSDSTILSSFNNTAGGNVASYMAVTTPTNSTAFLRAGFNNLFTLGQIAITATSGSTEIDYQATSHVFTGNIVNPIMVAPTLGAATATSINKVAITAPATSATLTIANSKTLTASNTLTLAGTDGTTQTFPTTSASIARIDAAQTFLGIQTHSIPSIGAGTTNDAVLLTNPTAAALGAQQNSPSLHFQGNGWGTTLGTSQSVDWKIVNAITQSTAPIGVLSFSSSIAGAAYSNRLSIQSNNQVITTGQMFANLGFFANLTSLATTTTDGFAATNGTAATSGVPVQISPRSRWSGNGWTGAASQQADWIATTVPVSGASPITSRWELGSQINGGGFTTRLAVTDDGKVGVGTTTSTPNAKLEVLSTTEQLRLDYDATHYTSFTVNSAGDLALGGTTGKVTLNGNVLFGTDNTYDIGANAATRPKKIYTADQINSQNNGFRTEGNGLGIFFGRSLTVSGGNFDITSTNSTLSGDLKIGAATASAASAQLEIVSTTRGFLPPRMTATQGSAISSPAEGLLIYVTDTNGTFTAKGWWGYDGAAWQKLNN